MAILRHHHTPSSLLDSLYCDEEKWEEDHEEVVVVDHVGNDHNALLLPQILSHQDLFWEDEELTSLLSKEGEACLCFEDLCADLALARRDAIVWMLKVKAHYGFSALTATLAINYLDRFLSSFHFQREKPWMIQLVAVTCLSLAAKVDETHVPLLLDFQVIIIIIQKRFFFVMSLDIYITCKWT